MREQKHDPLEIDLFRLDLSKVAAYIDTLIQKYGPDATLDFRATDEYGYPDVCVDVSRPETDEEMNMRISIRAKYEELNVEARRREYEKLKKEFGS